MSSRLYIFMCTVFLAGCFPDAVNDLDDGDSSGSVSSVSEGPASLRLVTAQLDNSNYPLAVKAEITASAKSTYKLTLDADLIAEGSMPVNGLLQGPASGQTDGNNIRLVYFVIAQPGSHTITLTETLDGLTETDSALVSTNGALCEENSSFYINETGTGPDTFDECASCHSSSGEASFDIDGSSYSSIVATETFNSTSYFDFAHMPANMDPTPGTDSYGGEFEHSGGLKWSQDSTTHFRTLELSYRVAEGFTCP